MNNHILTQDEITQFHAIIDICENDLKINPYGFALDGERVKKIKERHKLILQKVKRGVKS